MAATYDSIPTAEAVPVGPPVVQVVAPTTMEAGYTFQATYNGVVFPVIVPAGGVQKGQTFTVPFGDSTPFLGDYEPSGHWKDGLCDCFTLGLCHPSLWNALCCPQILMGQVLTRLQLTWLAEPAADTQQWRMTFRRILVIVVAYWLITSLFSPTSEVDEETGVVVTLPQPFWQVVIYNVTSMAFGIYSLVVMIKLRMAIRQRYRIPTTTACGDGVEDCCCIFWLSCCNISQMARHTADYEQKRALCCSDTGLPPSTPVLIV